MSTHFNQKKVLVVDDFNEMRKTLSRMLQGFGVKSVDEAATGEEAVAKIAKEPYDIIVCDYYLGEGKDGQQVLEEIKHRGLFKSSGVFIMVTAEASVDMVLGAVEYQPDGYLTKPFTKEALKLRLEKLLAKKSEFREIQEAMDQKDYARAIALCDEGIRTHERNPYEYLKLRGELCLASGAYAEAKVLYERMLAVRSLPWARMGLGKAHFLQQDYVAARDVFQQIIQENRMYMEAYDWLAKACEALGDSHEAQQILMDAASLSPRAIQRQKALGRLALDNRDFAVAENAYKAAVKLGKHSCLKSASDYTGLTRALMANDALKDALKVIETARSEFVQTPELTYETTLLEGVLYQKMKQPRQAAEALGRAAELAGQLTQANATEISMEAAKTLFELGEKSEAVKLLKQVIRNHHDDDEVLRQVREVFEGEQMLEEGARIIDDTREEMVALNNRGVHLAKEGKLEDSIELFLKAADGLPRNKTINLNAAQVLITHMQKHGTNAQYLRLSKEFLDRVERIDPKNEKCELLLNLHRGLPA